MAYAQELLALAREAGKDTGDWGMIDLMAWAHDEVADYDEKKDKGTQKEKIKTLLHNRALVTEAGVTKEDSKSDATPEQRKSVPAKVEKEKGKTIREQMAQKAKDQEELDEETGGRINKKQAEEDADELIKRG